MRASFLSINYKYLGFTVGVTVVLLSCLEGKLQFPGCPFSQFLNFCCPMCGSTRAWRALLSSGDITKAFLYNPIFWLWGFWCTIAYLDLWCKVFGLGNPTLGEKMLIYVSKTKFLLHSHLLFSFLTLIYLNLPVIAEWRHHASHSPLASSFPL